MPQGGRGERKGKKNKRGGEKKEAENSHPIQKKLKPPFFRKRGKKKKRGKDQLFFPKFPHFKKKGRRPTREVNWSPLVTYLGGRGGRERFVWMSRQVWTALPRVPLRQASHRKGRRKEG